MNTQTDPKNKNSRQNSQRKFGKLDGWLILFLYGCTMLFLFFTVPPLLSPARKAKQVEAKQITGAMVRSQHAYFLENQTFARQLESLGIGIRSESKNYSYRILFPSDPTPTQPSLVSETQNFYALAIAAYPKTQKPKYTDPTKVYLGIVWTTIDSSTIELIPQRIVCVSQKSLNELKAQKVLFLDFAYPNQKDTDFSCPIDFIELGK